MKNSFLIIMICFLGLSALGQDHSQKLQELLTAYGEQGKCNGCAMVYSKGKTIFQNCYGTADYSKKIPLTTSSIFQIGSITKQFTSLVILKLVEKKKLKLSDPISKWFPDFPRGNEITVHHLLSHTSGIFNYTKDGQFMMSKATLPATSKEIIALFKDKPLDFDPGTKYSYSNSGYMMMGYIINKVTKKPYEYNVRKYVFKPLGMSQSGFDFVNLSSEHKTKGYFSIQKEAATECKYVDSTVSYAAGSMYSTIGDMLLWHKGLMTNKLVKRSTLEKAFTPVLNNYGYGWLIHENGGKKMVHHNGGIFGFNATFYRVEADDECVIVLNNMGNPVIDDIAENMIKVLNNQQYQLPSEKVEIQLETSVMQQYVGSYELMPGFLIAITLENGQLMAQATSQPKFQLFAEKSNYFFVKAVEAEVEFVKNNDGKYDKMILYQGGAKTEGKRVK
jgi:CubicO group peptidase (beta-lactamase class C family)